MEKTHIHIASSNNGLKEHEPSAEKRNCDVVVVTNKTGLLNVRAIIFLLLWYVFSGCTLFLNKYILKYLDGNPWILGKWSMVWVSCCVWSNSFYLAACQMLMTTTCGFVQMYFPCGMYKPSQRLNKPPGFFRHMILVGCTRLVVAYRRYFKLSFLSHNIVS